MQLGFLHDSDGNFSAMRLALVLVVATLAFFGVAAIGLIIYVLIYERDALQSLALALGSTGGFLSYAVRSVSKFKAVQAGVEAMADNPQIAAGVQTVLGKAGDMLQLPAPVPVPVQVEELVPQTLVAVPENTPLVLSSSVSAISDELRTEFRTLFESAHVSPAHLAEVKAIAAKIKANHARYQAVAAVVGIPWVVIGLIHNMEGSLSFTTHLHNGDPLRARTVNVPRGRPLEGKAPFRWEDSAVDALRYDKFDQWKDWSLEGLLWELEKYNGVGTRRHGIHTPYLWSYTQHYVRGKYVADGKWDATAVSKQAGAAAILRVLVDNGTVSYS